MKTPRELHQSLMGVAPTAGDAESESPAAVPCRPQTLVHDAVHLSRSSTSVWSPTMSLSTSRPLLVGSFRLRPAHRPRAEHPIFLVLEESHRFIPSRRVVDGGSAGQERCSNASPRGSQGRALSAAREPNVRRTQRDGGRRKWHHERATTLARSRPNLTCDSPRLSALRPPDLLPSLAQQHALVTGVSTRVPVAERSGTRESSRGRRVPVFIRRGMTLASDSVAGARRPRLKDWLGGVSGCEEPRLTSALDGHRGRAAAAAATCRDDRGVRTGPVPCRPISLLATSQARVDGLRSGPETADSKALVHRLCACDRAEDRAVT